jgi:hypothetical protein
MQPSPKTPIPLSQALAVIKVKFFLMLIVPLSFCGLFFSDFRDDSLEKCIVAFISCIRINGALGLSNAIPKSQKETTVLKISSDWTVVKGFSVF